jgi:tuftelin-interacting protein 11
VSFVAKENAPPAADEATAEHGNSNGNNLNSEGKDVVQDDDAKEEFQKILQRVKQQHPSSSASDSAVSNGDSRGTTNAAFKDMVDKASISKPTYQPPPLTAAQTDMKWQKSTKGFGKKYLDKFGFSGRLGAKETGVSGVIEVKVRPNQMGLGFGNFTEQSAMESNRKLDAEVRGKEYVPLEKNKESSAASGGGKRSRGVVEDRAASGAWRLGGVSLKDAQQQQKQSQKQGEGGAKNKKAKKGVSFGDVFETSSAASSVKPPQVILDMRGATPRHITDTSTINDHESSDRSEGVAAPLLGQELLYNLNLIVDMDELALRGSEARLEALETRISSAEADHAELTAVADRDRAQLTALRSIDTILARMQEALAQRPLRVTREDILGGFRRVCVHFPEETKLLGLVDVLPAMAQPLLEHELIGWNPGEQSGLLVELYVEWMSGISAFEEEVREQAEAGGDIGVEGGGEAATSAAYRCLSLIIEKLSLPALRRYLVNDWETKDPLSTRTCADLLRGVKGIYPKENFVTLVESTVLPKIASAVRFWSPTTDRTPLHEWVLPWLGVIGRSVSSVFPGTFSVIMLYTRYPMNCHFNIYPCVLCDLACTEIRRKLASALSQWNPLDSSAFFVVKPWGGVFDERAMNDFLLRNIMPKLVMVVREQVIEPHGQSTQHLAAALLWAPLLPREDVLCLLEGEFFPKWFAVLSGWLSSAGGVDLVEVAKWYRNWRAIFPEEVAALPMVVHYFSEAVDMLAAALANQGQSGPPGVYSPPPALGQGLDYFQLASKHKAHQLALKRLESLGGKAAAAPSTAAGDPLFKDVVAAFALEHGHSFLPKRSATGVALTEDGMPLWVFGGRVTCFLDQSVVFVKRAEDWQPIGLDALLAMV